MRTPAKLTLLSSLYLSQGLPFGFFTQALPVLLRQSGVSLAAIGSMSLLALPWGLKFLWAPYVDRMGSARWGRRRSWILPLQASAVLLLLALSASDPKSGLFWVLAGVLCANWIAATQDIATDALAVELLSEQERGLGNGVQVAGYRVGMIVAGGLLLIVFDRLGWARTFYVMAALLALCSVPILLHRERPIAGSGFFEQIGFATIVRTLTRHEMRAFLPVLVSFKAGDAFGTAMLRPFLVDAGHGLSQIGWLLGTYGFVAGLLGALAGGYLTGRMQRRHALAWFGAGHACALLAYAACAVRPTHADAALYAALALEHFLGGMATAALFTCMMDRTRPEVAGTDYTVQASLVVGANGLFSLPSGLSAQHLGYPAHFALSALLGMIGARMAWSALAQPATAPRSADAA